MFMEAKRNYIKEEYLYIYDLPTPFDEKGIFFISDIHFRRVSRRLVHKAKSKADIVIIGGDLLEKNVPINRVRTNIRRLQEIGPVIFVWGNNDIEEQEQLGRLLEEEGVICLENDIYQWGIGRHKLQIAGLMDRYQKLAEWRLYEKTQQPIPVLVVHDPEVISKLNDPTTFDTALTGHTHGGQIRFGRFGIRERGGWKQRRGINVLISNGYGTTSLPLRFGAPAETHLLTLKSKV